MDNRDYRADPQYPQEKYPQEKRNNTGVWLGAVVVGALAAFALYGATKSLTEPMAAWEDAATELPADPDQMAPEAIEPAEGDSFTDQTAPVTPTPQVDAPAAAVAPAAVPPSYASEEDCKAATNVPCHFVTCDSVPAGKQPDEVCGADFKKGWQPLAATPDKTAVPEEVAPPLTGQGTAPVQNPPLAGQ